MAPQIKPNYQAATPANFNFWTQPQGISKPPRFNIPWLQPSSNPLSNQLPQFQQGVPQTGGLFQNTDPLNFGGAGFDYFTGFGPFNTNETIANQVLPTLMPTLMPQSDNPMNGLLPMPLFNNENLPPYRGGGGIVQNIAF